MRIEIPAWMGQESLYTGTLLIGRLLDFGSLEVEVQSSSAWSRGQLSVTIPTPGKVWTFIPFEGIPEGKSPVTYFHGGTVVLSLASIFNKNVANNAGWAVDGANLYARGNEDVGLQIEAKLAVRDSDGFLYRISYQVTALGSHNPPIQDFEGGVISQD